jgi:ribose transport system ATP-binding protein
MPPRLVCTGIGKRFPGVVALEGVSLEVQAGEVVAIVGENGAGKSTLMKIIGGVQRPDAGTITFEGEAVQFAGPLDAMAKGISLIHQELNLAENLSVLDNLFLGREATVGGPLRLLAHGQMASRGRALLARVGLPESLLHRDVESLAPGQKQLVEIARALGLNAKLLIMDEPTSSLTQAEADRLAIVIDELKASGVSVLYISHRLGEIRRSCDRAVVLRDGRFVGSPVKDELTHANLVRLMVGRDLTQLVPRTRGEPGDVVLKIDELRYRGGPTNDATFAVRAGEVLGMAGLVGAGRTELAEAVFGVRPIVSGTITFRGQPVTVRQPSDAIAAGILMVPEDRRLHGLVLDSSVGFNLSLPNLAALTKFGLVNPGGERSLVDEAIRNLGIKTAGAGKAVGLLSGGNQQKVVFGKWLARGPKLLILDEPTRGVDVGAKAEIYRLIDELAKVGTAIWMITSDMEELLGVSDRAIVLHEGRIVGELARNDLTERAVMTLATGGTP